MSTDQKQEVIDLANALHEKIDLSSPSNLVNSLTLLLAEQQLEREALVKEVNWIKASLKARDVILASADRQTVAPGVKEVDVVADMPLEGERGFYALEHDAGGHPYRWTGPTRSFSFLLSLDRREPLRFVLHCLHTNDPANSERMLCAIDNQPVELSHLSGLRQGFAFEGIVPAMNDEPGFNKTTTIQFDTPSVISPAELFDDSNDHRLLGVCFSRLSIRPA